MKTLAAAALLAGAAGFGGAWWLQGLRWEAADGRRAAADAESQRLAQRSADSAAARFEADRARIAAQRRTLIVEVDRVVESPVYRGVCLDDAGMRVLAAAVAGDDPGQPAPAVPAASAAR